MKFRSSNLLALAISDRGIVCAQVASDAKQRVVQKVARFVPTAEAPLDKPEQLGAALAAFLKEHQFTVSRAVIGVPARWLISQEKELPPVDATQAKAILLLQAERMSVGDGAELAVDVDGDLKGTGGVVLMVGMLKQRLAQLEKMAEAAELNLVVVTASALVMSRLVSADTGASMMVVDNGLEVVVRRGGAARLLRHISMAGTQASPALASELRRAMAAGGSELGTADRPLMLWDYAGAGLTQANRLTDQMGLATQQPSIQSLQATMDARALNGSPGGDGGVEGYLPAVALAIAGIDEVLPVDFLHSRLAAAPVKRFGRRSVWAGAIAAAIVIGMVLLYTTVTSRESEADALEGKYAEIKKSVAEAETQIAHVTYGRTYFEKRPPLLDNILELDTAFGYEEPIWVSSLTVRENRVGQLVGRADDQRRVLTLFDRLKTNKNLADVQVKDMRSSAGGRGGETGFSLSFTFTPHE
jgi:hypothetical protein